MTNHNKQQQQTDHSDKLLEIKIIKKDIHSMTSEKRRETTIYKTNVLWIWTQSHKDSGIINIIIDIIKKTPFKDDYKMLYSLPENINEAEIKATC